VMDCLRFACGKLGTWSFKSVDFLITPLTLYSRVAGFRVMADFTSRQVAINA
jgi:hypothetical protein